MANALRETNAPAGAGGTCQCAEEPLSRALVDLLLHPSAYPDRPSRVELVETHISWVFLTDRFVYKLKKPVRFDFLDYGTPEARRRACQAECELNQRLASDVYLGVLPITIDAKGKIVIGGSGRTVDWLVKMRRLPADKMLDELIRTGRLSEAESERLASWLAGFYHRLSPIFVEAGDYRAAIERHVRSNREELLSARHGLPAELVKRCHSAQLRFLALEKAQFEARVCDGRIVDGHGDLRPEHICLDGTPIVFDCVEFNAELRRIDVADELAFLAMECEHLGAERVGRRILEAYRQQSHDHFSAPLESFYKCYRACVRAKVAALAAAQDPAHSAAQRARAYLALADRCAAQLGPPTAIVVGGLMGSGKSTLASSLAELLGSDWLSTDAIRRELLGASAAPAAYNEGLYSPEHRQQIYNELLHRADLLLRARVSVVLDGAFLTAAQRQAVVGLARTAGAVPLVVRCACPAEVAMERIERRAAGSLSEARPELYAAQQAREEPFESRDTLSVDTTTPLRLQESPVLEELRARMPK
ncbi:MAG TPA: AAA family ATPase [Pirellulales bacterium]|nr:AAA family ATPase [Pirellulales bacterium]